MTATKIRVRAARPPVGVCVIAFFPGTASSGECTRQPFVLGIQVPIRGIPARPCQFRRAPRAFRRIWRGESPDACLIVCCVLVGKPCHRPAATF